MNTRTKTSLILCLAMMSAVLMAWAGKPTKRLASEYPLSLEAAVPINFGDWRLEQNASFFVQNAQQVELLQRLYSQTLSRTYLNIRSGQTVMLSIAYGEDQRDSMQIHYPEVCYPAQGLHVVSNRVGKIDTPQGSIPVRRLETRLGRERFEPLTYWIMIGDHVALEGVGKKIAELKYGLHGDIPDGLVFRVSSINRDSENAFSNQGQFISDLIAALPPEVRLRLTGLRTEASPAQLVSPFPGKQHAE